MKKVKWNRLGLVTVFTVIMCVISFMLANNVKADPQIINVPPGSGTLKAAIESDERQDGDILQLTDGYYNPGDAADKIANVSKNITIRGKGGQSVVNVPFKITATGGSKDNLVKLENFATSPVKFETDTKFINVTGPDVYLNMNDVVISGILRGDWVSDESSMLEVSDGADGANITVSNCLLVKTGVNYGIKVDANDTNITLKKTTVGSSASLFFNNGSNNEFNITEGSLIEGPAAQFEYNKVITINNQDELKLSIKDSTVEGEYPKNYLPVKVFAFDSESKNTAIDIKNSKIGYQNNSSHPGRRSTIFDFDSNAKAGDNNVITVDKDSSFSILNNSLEEALPLGDKYSTLNSASVVGIYDKDNNGVIKVYNNDTKLSDLDAPKYTELDGSAFKGWFKDIERTDEFKKVGEDYPTTQSGENMDLYPKFAKKLKVTIKNVNPDSSDNKDVSYDIEEGQTIEESTNGKDIKDALEKIKTKEGQDFRGYVIYNSNGNYTYEVGREDELIKELKMTENCTIEAIHRVKVTINDFDFYIESGQKLSDINTVSITDNKTSFEEAKMTGSDGRAFSRFVVKDSDTTVIEDVDTIPVNVKLVSRFLQNVTVKNVPTGDKDGSVSDRAFTLEEGLKLDSNPSIKEALDSISGEVEGRTFSKFINSNTKKEIKRDEYTIDDDIEIESVYTINVELQDKDNYTINAGSNLSSLEEEKENSVKSTLTEMSESVPDGKDFDGFVVSCDKDNTNKVFDYDDYNKDLNSLINAVMEYNLYYDSTIYARYNITVTIGGKEFDLESGDSLKTGILDKKEKVDEYNEAKLGGKDANRFSRFVKEDTDTTVDEAEEITESMTLVPKYFAFVTINDDRSKVGGTYKVEERKTIEDLDGVDVNTGVNDAKKALFNLRSDIVTDTENLHFEKIVMVEDGENKSIPSPIDKDIEIKGVYHYDVVVVEDYDNPINDEENTDHRYGFKVYRGETLSSNTSDSDGTKINEALDNLKKTATKEDGTRKFYSYIETNTEREFKYDPEDGTYQSEVSGGKQSLLETVFNRHLFITARVQYQVKIGDKSDYVIEGHHLSEYPDLAVALEGLNKDGKNIAKYTVDGKEIENNDEIGNTLISKATEIGATYNVVVTIGEDTFTLPEGGKLESLSTEEQGRVRKALEALRATSSDHHLKGYNVGNKFVKNEDDEDIIDNIIKNETFDVNTEITPAFDVRVTIGKSHFDLDAGKNNLSTLKTMDGYDNAVKKDNRKVVGFMDGDTKIGINDDYTFTKDTTLTPIYGIEVTVNGKDGKSEVYTLEEGQSLNDVIDKEQFTIDGKTLSFEDENGEVVDLSKTLGDDYTKDKMTLTAVYTIDVTINDYEGNFITKVTLDEGDNLDSDTSWKTKLEELAVNKTYDGLYDGDTKVKTDTSLNENTTYTAKYTVVVTIKDTKGNEKGNITIFEGDSLSKATGDEKEKLENILNEEKIVKESIDTGKVFTTNGEIIAKYYKTVTINGEKFDIEEGKSLQSLVDSGKLNSVMNPSGKHFVKFTKDGAEFASTTEINDDTILSVVYKIVIKVQTGKNVEEHEFVLEGPLADGVGLSDINGVVVDKHPDFYFETESGEKISEETPKFTSDTTIVERYSVKVFTDDHSEGYSLKDGQSLKDLDPEVLKALKINALGRKFSRFVNKNTGETIDEKDPIYEDVIIVPKFNINITVFRRDENGNEVKDDTVTFELGEDLALSKVAAEEGKKLQDWVDEVVKKLEKEGKANYAWTKFLTEDGKDIDVNNYLFSQDSRIEAVFEEKKPDTPDLGDITGNDDNNTTSTSVPKDKPSKVPVPDTGKEMSNLVSSVMSGFIFVLITLLVFGPAVVLQAEKFRNK